jgi:undecaprenyl phosphate-alpha-L-ara4N flippase subunit ArnE
MKRLLLIVFLAQVFLVAGQILLKHGMNYTKSTTIPARRIVRNILSGILMLTLWFFLWMGLLQRLDLSYVYPFEGISPVLLVLAACVILKESLDRRSWIGVGLIAFGTFLVGFS